MKRFWKWLTQEGKHKYVFMGNGQYLCKKCLERYYRDPRDPRDPREVGNMKSKCSGKVEIE